MKTKEELMKDLIETLDQVERFERSPWSETKEKIVEYLNVRLDVLEEILFEDLPEDMWWKLEERKMD